jgi:hypothetical protein
MPHDFPYEVAVTSDHETGVCLVDTTIRSVATRLLRCGFQEVTPPGNEPYRRFRGEAGQIRFIRPKLERRKSRPGPKALSLERCVNRANQEPGSKVDAQDVAREKRQNRGRKWP